MIGAIKQINAYFNPEKPKQAQTVPASLFWREGGFGIFVSAKNAVTEDSVTSMDDLAASANGLSKNRLSAYKAMPFDLFISEKNSLKFRVSEHPLQDGSTITDHIHREMREVTVEGLFTNHHMKKNVSHEVKFRDQYGTRDEVQTFYNTALAKFNKLKRLANERKTVRLVCALEIYPKMVITGIDYDRDSKSGSAIRFTMTLRELRTASLKAFKSDYAYQPGALITANDKMIAAKKKMGKKTAEMKEAEEIAKQTKKAHNMEIVD